MFPMLPAPLPEKAIASPVARWVWALPVVLFVLTTPLWMQWTEPGLFLSINQWSLPVPAPVWTGFSILGNGWGVLAATAPLLVLAPRYQWAWLCAAPFAVLFARGGKFLIESPRPAAVVDNSQMRVVGELLHNVSMPSGHTLTAFAVAAGIYFAIPLVRRRRYVWLWLLAAGTGLSRIAVGAHWPGDVAVGAALGVLAGLLGHQLWLRMAERHCAPQSWGLRTVACLVGLAVYHLLAEELDFAENQPAQYVLAAVATLSLLAFAWQSFQAKLAYSPHE
jgi:membrane-associated phospholipid phosphatase